MTDNVIFLTADWFKKLEDELKNLKEVKRVEIAEKLKEAISFWDLSENAEYEDARNEQAQVELRIKEIEDQLKRVEIIKEKWGKKKGKINMWMVVKIENIETKEIETYKIVWTQESDILNSVPKISNESPVWKKLLWKSKWDIIKVKTPSKVFEYKIIDVK